ncbi:MAG TPA: tetraacyldisaccharide 4'-kinase [Betaproteobacteria bacterium]|nr:tetraacyldisaccharide 4'-kinase [Betaproteobacteria bacterium]
MNAPWLESQWSTITRWHVLLWPLSLLFGFAVAFRRLLYRWRIIHSDAVPVPVIVVGNITVGGTGKTPAVVWIADFLRRRGYRPGVISRGYGRRSQATLEVTENSDPLEVGDEPLLLARRTGCPIVVGADRVLAARGLLRRHPECDVLLSDDGLQHYALRRDMEIAVVDAQRYYGNRLLLPAGPLRERLGRLESVDAVLLNGDGQPTAPNQFRMRLTGEVFYNVGRPELRVGVSRFQGKAVHAMAGIGNPQRFFDDLRALGLVFTAHAFPDHYVYTPADLNLPRADAIIMTEKDAVKCAAFADPKCWALAVDADIDPALEFKLLDTIRKHHGRKAA